MCKFDLAGMSLSVAGLFQRLGSLELLNIGELFSVGVLQVGTWVGEKS